MWKSILARAFGVFALALVANGLCSCNSAGRYGEPEPDNITPWAHEAFQAREKRFAAAAVLANHVAAIEAYRASKGW